MNKFIQKGVLVFLIFFGFQVTAQETVWLSNTPPDTMKGEVKTSGMHRYSSLKNKIRSGKTKNKESNSSYTKKLVDSSKKQTKKQGDNRKNNSYRRSPTKYVHWLRRGNSVKDAEYICLPDSADYQLTLMSPKGNAEPITLVKNKACYAKFELNEEGYYNAYLILKKSQGDTLYVSIAKAELLSHSCRNGHHKKLESRPVRYYPEITDFEMIRERHPHEDYHFFTLSGDTETFQTLLDGKPLAGVKITINTEKGWSNTTFTDNKGELKIQFIQDYFSNWQELNKRKIHNYMIKAEYTLPKDIQYKGKEYKYIHYTLTMSDAYRPSRTMYASMVWGLIVFLIAMLASITGFYIYKERRKRPYKEIEFNESNT